MAVTNLDAFLENARSRIDRVEPKDLEMAMSGGALLIDIRPVENRSREGDMPGAMVIDRLVLEWRLAPSSDHRIVNLEPGQQVIVFCNEGYSSSLAAATLRELGVDGATDLVGGYRAWKETQTG